MYKYLKYEACSDEISCGGRTIDLDDPFELISAGIGVCLWTLNGTKGSNYHLQIKNSSDVTLRLLTKDNLISEELIGNYSLNLTHEKYYLLLLASPGFNFSIKALNLSDNGTLNSARNKMTYGWAPLED